jgi:hypothetical protein
MNKEDKAAYALRVAIFEEKVALLYTQNGFIKPPQVYGVIRSALWSICVDEQGLDPALRGCTIIKGTKAGIKRKIVALFPGGYFKKKNTTKWAKEHPHDWRKKAEEKRLDQQLERHLNEPDKEQKMNTTGQLELPEERQPTIAEIKKNLNDVKLKERVAANEMKAAAREQKELEKMLLKAEKEAALSRPDFKHVEISHYKTGKVHGKNDDIGYNFQVHRKKSSGKPRKYLGCVTPERDKITDELLKNANKIAFDTAKKCCGMLDKALED